MLNQRNKRIALSMILLLVLSGCVGRTSKGEPTGWVWDLLGKPMEQLIFFFANQLGQQQGRFGWAIIIVTIIIRLIITPLHIKMMDANIESQERMTYIKPHMEKITAAMRQAQTPAEQMALRQAQLNLQTAAGVRFISAQGCLPIFIQLPVFAALYAAATSSKDILSDIFLGIPLGQFSVIFMILSSFFYLLQGLISQIGMTPEQKQMNQSVLWLSPMLNLVFALSVPAGAVLYWTIGGLFSCVTSFYTSVIQKPRIKAMVAEDMKTRDLSIAVIKDVTPNQTPPTQPAQRRNVGKQNR